MAPKNGAFRQMNHCGTSPATGQVLARVAHRVAPQRRQSFPAHWNATRHRYDERLAMTNYSGGATLSHVIPPRNGRLSGVSPGPVRTSGSEIPPTLSADLTGSHPAI